ncbi:hypothetical protein GEMRC1_006689 [Eukaryota sp. GEM-RC1]
MPLAMSGGNNNDFVAGLDDAIAVLELLHKLMDNNHWVGRELVIPSSEKHRFVKLCEKIFEHSMNLLKTEPITLDVPSPCYVLGDLHGNMLDLSFYAMSCGNVVFLLLVVIFFYLETM